MRAFTSISSCTLILLLSTLPAPIQADSLNIYGLTHLSLDYNDSGASAASTDTVIASNSSRVGLTAELALTENYEMFVQFEPGVDLTGRGENDGNGPGRFDSLLTERRDSFIGVRNRLGALRIGRLGVLNHWLYDFDPFADLVGDLGNLWGATGIPGRANRASLLEIFGNANVGMEFMWVPEKDLQTQIHMAKFKFSLDKLRINVSVFEQGVSGATNEHSATSLTGDLELSNGLLGFGAQIERDIFGQAGNDATSVTLGYVRQAGPGTAKLMLTRADSERGDFDGTQWSLGYDYPVKSDFTVYVAAGYVSNGSRARFPANGYGHGLAITPSPGDDPYTFSIGFLHRVAMSFSN